MCLDDCPALDLVRYTLCAGMVALLHRTLTPLSPSECGTLPSALRLVIREQS